MTPEEIKAQGYTILTDPAQIKDYKIAGQYGKTNAPGSFLYGTLKDQPIKTETGMIDTGSAIKQVNKQNDYLNGVSPASPPLAPTVTPTPTPEKTQGKAYFTNQVGQEAEYTQEQLNDPTIQDFLKNNGYVLAKSDGVNVGTDYSTSKLQTGYETATKEVEDLANEMKSWNIDTDPEFAGISQAIKGDYDKLRNEMQKTNYQRQRAMETLGFRTGATQYAGAIQMGVEGEEIRQGGERLNEITRQESAAIAAARSAYKNDKWSEFNNQVNVLKDLGDEKSKQLTNYNKTIADTINNLREQQKFDLEVLKYQSELKAKDKPMVVSPGSSIYDPDTGAFVGTAPERPSDNKPITEQVGNTLLQWNPNLKIWETVYRGGTEVNGSALDWAKSIANGTAKLEQVPSDIRSQVVTALNSLPPDQSKIAPLKDKINEIDSLLKSPGMAGTVGSYGISRWTPFTPDAAARQDFIAGVQQLISQDTLQTLIDLKAQGGTLGALSDTERVMLQSAASKIGTWALRDKDTGEIIGYKISEDLFKKELNKIKEIAQRAVEKAGGNTVESASKAIDDFYLQNPDKREMIDRLDSIPNPNTGQPYTDEEKAEILGISFKQVGGDTKLASKVASIPDFSKGGQCGRFVNKLTGLGVGDSYASKMAKMDKTITTPAPGMVFVMPYKDTGHTGIILSVDNGIATVKDSNYGLDEKVKTHQIPVYKMTGFRKIS